MRVIGTIGAAQMIATILTASVLVVNLIALLAMLLRSRKSRSPRSYGFFHPYCNAGGGGERVLWTAVRCMQQRFVLEAYSCEDFFLNTMTLPKSEGMRV